MSDNKIGKWAAYAEIGGTIAVVISLIFVIKSIDQNTKAIEAAEMNNIYSAYREIRHLPILADENLARTIVKARSREALSAVEQLQWNVFREGQLDNWSQLYALLQNNLISQETWEGWDSSYWLQWHKNDMAEEFQDTHEFQDAHQLVGSISWRFTRLPSDNHESPAVYPEVITRPPPTSL